MSNPIPEPSSTYEAVRTIVEPIYYSLKTAAQKAKTQFNSERPFDPYVFSIQVRYEVKLDLLGAEWNVREESGTDFKGQANVGLRIDTSRHVIRIRKTDNMTIPPAGTSKTMNEFMNQQLPMDLPGVPEAKISLLVLWQVDADQNLKNAYLACPKSVISPYGRVEPHWILSVPDRINNRIATLGVDEPSPGDIPLPGESNEQSSSA